MDDFLAVSYLSTGTQVRTEERESVCSPLILILVEP